MPRRSRRDVAHARGAGRRPRRCRCCINTPARELSVTLSATVSGEKRVSIADRNGLVWAEGAFERIGAHVEHRGMPAGAYTLRVTGDNGLIEERKILIRP